MLWGELVDIKNYIDAKVLLGSKGDTMLMDIMKFIGMLFLFGLCFFVVWAMIEFVDEIMPITGEFRIVIFGLFTAIPLIYFIGRARELWLQTHIAED